MGSINGPDHARYSFSSCLIQLYVAFPIPFPMMFSLLRRTLCELVSVTSIRIYRILPMGQFFDALSKGIILGKSYGPKAPLKL